MARPTAGDGDARGAVRSGDGRRTTTRRLLWFALLWIGGVAAVGAVALLIRTALGV